MHQPVVPAGRRRRPSDPTVGEFLDTWLSGKGRLRASTRRSYQIHVDRHIRPALGEIPLRELGLADLERFYARLASGGSGLSTATVQRIHATLSSALNSAVRRGLIPVSPAALVELPTPAPAERATWSVTEARRFLAGIEGDEWEVMFRLLLLGGLRRGEVLGLRWQDADLDQRLIRVRQQVVQIGADLVINPPKSRRGVRPVSIDSGTATLLARLRASSAPSVGVELLFPGVDGGPVRPSAVSQRFEHLVAELGLPRIRLHDLRHASASIGLAAGESLVEVSRRLGHSSVSITGDVYSHLDPTLMRASADRIAGLCTGETAEPDARDASDTGGSDAGREVPSNKGRETDR